MTLISSRIPNDQVVSLRKGFLLHVAHSSLYHTGSSVWAKPLMIKYIYMGWGEAGFNCWGVRGPELILFLFYVNEPAVSLILPAFDDTGSLDFPPRQVVYPPV